MSSFEALQERLTALQETTGQLKELIDRLATIKFQPGSVALTSSISSLATSNNGDNGGDSGNPATELSSEITQILREEEEELELLQEEIVDLRSGRPGSEAEHRKRRLKEGTQRLETELKSCRTAFRKAQLSARRNLESAQKLERELLLASYTAMAASSAANSNRSGATSPALSTTDTTDQQSSQQQQQPSKPKHTQLFTARDRRRLREKQLNGGPSENSDVVTTSSDVTEALRRTHALIAGEVTKSAFVAKTLADSTAALRELQNNYEGIDSLLSKSQDLLQTLLKSEKSDTWYLRTSLYVLLATFSWLIFRRFLYGPLWWALWLFVRLPLGLVWRTGNAVSNMGDTAQPQEGASMKLDIGVEEGGRTASLVRMGQEGAVPTAEVGGQKQKSESGDPDSMVEKVGKIIEDSLGEDGELLPGRAGEENDQDDPSLAADIAAAQARNESGASHNVSNDDEENQPRNPMKRMWEEDKEAAKQAAREAAAAAAAAEERVRDEL